VKLTIAGLPHDPASPFEGGIDAYEPENLAQDRNPIAVPVFLECNPEVGFVWMSEHYLQRIPLIGTAPDFRTDHGPVHPLNGLIAPKGLYGGFTGDGS